MVFLAVSVQLLDVARFTAGHNASVPLYVVILKATHSAAKHVPRSAPAKVAIVQHPPILELSTASAAGRHAQGMFSPSDC